MGAAKAAAKTAGTVALLDVAVKTATAVFSIIVAVKAIKALAGTGDSKN